MPTVEHVPVTERLFRLFEHLEIERAHLAAAGGLETATFAAAAPHRIASLTYVCPARFAVEGLQTISTPLLLIHGDRGPASSLVPRALPDLPGAQVRVLEDYVDGLWVDAAADRRSEIGKAMLSFLSEVSNEDQLPPLDGAEERGEVAGITYHARGSGPPLILFPLDLAPSQWEPLIPLLSRHFRTFTLGGTHLWVTGLLEQRMRAGYGVVARSVVETCAPQPGERVLDAGCGSGPVVRWLACSSAVARPIVGVDINPYLLREAEGLAAAGGVADDIVFQQADVKTLPFPTESFDVTLAFTLLDWGDADQMLAELVRVTRPGGRIGIIVRAKDMSGWDSLELPEAIRIKLATAVAGSGSATAGCTDASLYRRMRAIGLEELKMGPQLGICAGDPSLDIVLRDFEYDQLGLLDARESEIWREAADQAMATRTILWAEPLHCAVGTKR